MPMADLRSMMNDLGFVGVQTYIQSGNVAFDDGPDASAEASRLISTGIEDAFGFEVPVVVLTHGELVQARRHSQRHFPAGQPECFPHEKNVHVVFLSESPDQGTRLEANRFPNDRFMLDGRELHVRYSDGAGQSKLTLAAIEKAYGVNATARNLATVDKLIEMAAA